MYKIAIVDDEHEILNMLKSFFDRDGGFSVSVFDNPNIALNDISSGDYDIVLLDIMMPGLDGIEFLKRIHQVKPDLKVIMMTAFDTLEREIEAHKYNANNYLTKPFSSLSYVKEKVLEVLNGEED